MRKKPLAFELSAPSSWVWSSGVKPHEEVKTQLDSENRKQTQLDSVKTQLDSENRRQTQLDSVELQSIVRRWLARTFACLWGGKVRPADGAEGPFPAPVRWLVGFLIGTYQPSFYTDFKPLQP